MRSPTSPDRTGRRRWLGWTLAGVVGTALVAGALWLCVALLPQRLYPPLSKADLAGLSPADQAARREGRDKLQNDARTTLLQGLAALLVLAALGSALRSPCGRSVSAASSSSRPASRRSAATIAPANNSNSPASRPSAATNVSVSRSQSPRKARSPSGSPAPSTSSASPA
jgi:MFS family permease